MTDTMFDVVYHTAVALGIVSVDTTATGGSTTTIVDTKRTEADDLWNGGTAFAMESSEYSKVTDYVLSTHTITVSPAFSQVMVSGNRYALAKKRYPLDIIVQQINRALQSLGSIAVTDTDSIVTVTSQTEYDLPVEASYDLRQVWFQTNTTSSTDNEWVNLHNWSVQPGDIGVGNVLVLHSGLDGGYKLKLVYTGKHPTVYSATDEISESVYIDRLVASAVVNCMTWLYQKTNDITVMQQLTAARQKQAEADQRYPMRLPHRTTKLLTLSNNSESDDIFPKVRL